VSRWLSSATCGYSTPSPTDLRSASLLLPRDLV
jgi:hypothetical protein